MRVLYLTEAEVRSLLDIRTTIDLVQEAFRQLAAGEAMNVPRQRATAPGVVLHTMSAAATYLGVVGWKSYTTTAAGAQFQVALFDQKDGRQLALLEADWLGRLRTGAATGVAAESMADMRANEIGIFGTGKQAETQLAALCTVRDIHKVWVYSRNDDRRNQFADRMTVQLGIPVEPVDRPQEAVEDLPIVVAATTSREPVFDGNWLAEGAFVAAVGSNALNRAEIDTHVIRRADTIVCDSVDCCRHEAGDFVEALQRGLFDWSRAFNLCDVVTGRASGRYQPESVCLFKSVGMALEDIAVASHIVALATKQGVGKHIEL